MHTSIGQISQIYYIYSLDLDRNTAIVIIWQIVNGYSFLNNKDIQKRISPLWKTDPCIGQSGPKQTLAEGNVAQKWPYRVAHP